MKKPEKKKKKNRGFNGIRTRDLRDTGAMQNNVINLYVVFLSM